jgi:hypothetical protein
VTLYAADLLFDSAKIKSNTQGRLICLFLFYINNILL